MTANSWSQHEQKRSKKLFQFNKEPEQVRECLYSETIMLCFLLCKSGAPESL